MLCAECGHNLERVADGAPCTECGVVTPPDMRLPQPLPSRVRLLVMFGWPLVLAWALGAVGIFSIAGSGSPLIGLLAITAFVIVGPLNSALRTRALMKRLPRRICSAPLLFMIPRVVAVPILVGLATIIIFSALTLGACLGVMVLGGAR